MQGECALHIGVPLLNARRVCPRATGARRRSFRLQRAAGSPEVQASPNSVGGDGPPSLMRPDICTASVAWGGAASSVTDNTSLTAVAFFVLVFCICLATASSAATRLAAILGAVSVVTAAGSAAGSLVVFITFMGTDQNFFHVCAFSLGCRACLQISVNRAVAGLSKKEEIIADATALRHGAHSGPNPTGQSSESVAG